VQQAQQLLACDQPKVLVSSPTSPQKAHGYDGVVQFDSAHFVQQDVWSQKGAQQMVICNASQWEATAIQDGKPESGVKTYPDSELRFTDYSKCDSQPLLGTFKTMRGKYAHVSPNSSSYDFAWDIFINSGACKNGPKLKEIMVWTQWHDVNPPDPLTTTVIDGVHYDVYYKVSNTTGSYIQLRMHEMKKSGEVDFVKVFDYLAGVKLLDLSADNLQFVQYGVEILTTCTTPYTIDCKGVNTSFGLTAFGVSYTQ
jgi:hypothetical protein